jgi:hypothetical protein
MPVADVLDDCNGAIPELTMVSHQPSAISNQSEILNLKS